MVDHTLNSKSNAELISLLKTVLDVDHCGLVVVNSEGIISFVNNTYAELFDKQPQEMIGKHVNDAYVNSEPSGLPRVLRTGKPDIGDVYYLNGRYVVANRFPIYEDGKIVGALGKVIFRDIDEFTDLYHKVKKDAWASRNEMAVHPSIKYDLNNIIGRSPQVIDLKESIDKIAPRNSTVLLRGESGTGKELFAHAIHTASNRRNNPFIKVNCAAIPENLLESELFGFIDGAFTGARKGGKKGKFELADKGTIFLDEIGDMGFHMQAKLLRVLQEKEIEPLGSHETKTVDVRIIAATNVYLEELIKYGKFRADLYYRLNVVSLKIPSLRERKEDLELLVDYFIRQFNQSFSLNVKKVSVEVMDLFKQHNWPGNVRELENVMEQAFNFVEGPIIGLEHVPSYLLSGLAHQDLDVFEETTEDDKANSGGFAIGSIKDNLFEKHDLAKMVDWAEKEMIEKALHTCKGNKVKAAQMLGISRTGIYKKLAKYQID